MVDVIRERSDLRNAVVLLTDRGNNHRQIAEILNITLAQVAYYRRPVSKKVDKNARPDPSGDPVNQLLMRRWGK